MPILEYKVLSHRYDTFLTLVGLFVPVPMSSAKHTPDFVIKGWGVASTVALTKYHIPLGVIMIIIAIIF